jgi:hypothetical protein
MLLPMSTAKDSVSSQTVFLFQVLDLFGNEVLVILKVECYNIISLTMLHLRYLRELSEPQTFYKIPFHIYATRNELF